VSATTDSAATVPRTVAGSQRRRRPLAAAARIAQPIALGLLGFAGLMALWALIGTQSPDLPTPIEAWEALRTVLASPFHDNGPNDKGIAIQMWSSLQRVFLGFGMAMVVAIPIGFAMGASKIAMQAINPIVQLLRPVSPLAWFPIALVIFKDAPKAAIYAIAITSVWPVAINTAFGVASVPQDHRNVARVFKFGRWRYVRQVLLPYSLPSIVTGMRISMGIAWMVIVAVEMLSGSTGIGYFVWDSYNAGNNATVCAAIALIGAVGLVLDAGFGWLLRRVTYMETA